jgi:cob(I)alamin adenosyltransferase
VKLYTKQGDDGGTVLFDGSRVRKDHPRVETYGTVDELNANLGVAAAGALARRGEPGYVELHERLMLIQCELFSIGAELATPIDARNRHKIVPLAPEPAHRLEKWIDEASEAPPPLRTFVLPGGEPLAAQLHVCRTVCRRAERGVVTLAQSETLNPQIIIYLNRLSDLLFAWARLVNHLSGRGDVPWTTSPPPKGKLV